MEIFRYYKIFKKSVSIIKEKLISQILRKDKKIDLTNFLMELIKLI